MGSRSRRANRCDVACRSAGKFAVSTSEMDGDAR
jgi:hypothetical protein